MPKIRALATLLVTAAGAIIAEPKCPRLADAEPSALVSYLDGSMASQPPACVEYAIGQLGERRYGPAADTLIRHLGFRREPDFWEKGEDVVELQHEWYPAATALFQIGKPALQPLIDLLGTETPPVVRAKALQTVVDICRDDFVSAVKLLRAAAAKQGDSAAKTRLLDAAGRAVQMCPRGLRPQCEDALR